MNILPEKQNFHLAEKLNLDLVAMSMHVRNTLVERIAQKNSSEIDAVIREAALDYGGTIIEPGQSNWDPMECQISILGCSGFGTDVADATHQWAKAADRMSKNQQPAAA